MKYTEIKDLNFDEFRFHLKNSGIYLDINFNLDFLSNYLGIQTYKTSRLLREKYNISFSDLKNYLRIDLAIDKIKDGYLEKHTIDALAKECGYKGRSNFSSVFFTFTGMTVVEANNKFFIRKNKEFLIHELK